MNRSLALLVFTAALLAETRGPSQGALVIVGGGAVGPAIAQKFLELAGGPQAPILVVPTADTADEIPAHFLEKMFLTKAGAKNLRLLHTRDRKVADTEEFAAAIRTARGVWFTGGRQWRLVDSYLHTRTHHEIVKLLERGGVVGGTSAGATIQGSYLVRGAREGNHIMMAPGYEEGLALLTHSAIDQHLIKRKRENDLVPVIEKHPSLLGIGLDESTAIVVRGQRFDVIGESKVAIYEKGKQYYFLSPGDAFDLTLRRKLTAADQDAERTYQRALALSQQGQRAEATAALESVLKANPQHAAAASRLAVLYMQASQVDAAVTVLQDALDHSPHDEDLNVTLARVHLVRGDRESARAILEAFLRVRPTSEKAAQVLAQVQ
jgi:cyanophycinase